MQNTSVLRFSNLQTLTTALMSVGGRVSDSFDRRILTTYLEEYLGDFLFDTFQPFHLYSSVDGTSNIDVPPPGSKDVYTRAIEGLPLVQTPEVGLVAEALSHMPAGGVHGNRS